MSDYGLEEQIRWALLLRASKLESLLAGGQTMLTRRSGDECEVITDVVERHLEPSSRDEDFL